MRRSFLYTHAPSRDICVVRRMDDLGRITIHKPWLTHLNVRKKEPMAQFGMAGGVFVTPFRNVCRFCHSILDTIPLDDDTSICRNCTDKIQDLQTNPEQCIRNMQENMSAHVFSFFDANARQAPVIRNLDSLNRIVVIKELRRIWGWEPGTQIAVCAVEGGIYLTSYELSCRLCDRRDALVSLGSDIWVCEECVQTVGRLLDKAEGL